MYGRCRWGDRGMVTWGGEGWGRLAGTFKERQEGVLAVCDRVSRGGQLPEDTLDSPLRRPEGRSRCKEGGSGLEWLSQ